MEKERKIKKYSVIALVVALLGLTIVYAAISISLNINASARANKSGVNVVFEKIPGISPIKSNGVLTTLDEPELIRSGTTLNLGDITLNNPGDYYQYSINIINKGKLTAEISGIETPNVTALARQYFDISFKYEDGISVGVEDILSSRQTKKVIIKVSLKELTDEEYDEMPDDLVLNLNNITIIFERSEIAEVTTTTSNEPACVSSAPEGAIELGTSGEEFYKLWETNDEIAYLAKYNLIYGKKVLVATMDADDFVYEKDGNDNDIMYTQARQGSTCGSESRGMLMDYDEIAAAYNAAYQSGSNEAPDISEYIHTPWYSTSFSASAYWDENNEIKSTYANNIKYDAIHSGNIAKATVGGNGYPIYVFDENSSIYSIVQQYGTYLSQNGVNVAEARLLTYEEAVAQGCTSGSCKSAPSWLTYTSYWLGSAIRNIHLYFADSNGNFSESKYDGWETLGVRPVIVVSKSN